jgi:hypothetical protein
MSPLLSKAREIYHQHQHHHEVPRLGEILDVIREAGAAALEGSTRTAEAIRGNHTLELSSQNPLPLTAQASIQIKEPVLVKAALELPTIDIPALEHIAVQLPSLLVAIYALAGSIILSAVGIILAEVLKR